MTASSPARNGELEAAIAAAPDRPDAYLVYADWLQTRGDPRGTLIALHDAMRLDPSNGPARAAATELLASAGRELLGELHMRNDVDVTWYQGFVHTVRLRGATIQQILSALRSMHATPAGAFVQAIAITHVEEPDRVVRLLVETRLPRTLRHLAIGKPSQWAIPPELVAAFPKLARDPIAAWEAALAAAAAVRRMAVEVDVAALPALVPREGFATADLATIVLGLKAEIAKQRPIGMLAALPGAFTRESLDAFAVALATQWEAIDTPAVKWALDAIGSLGGDRCVGFLAERFATWSHPRAVQALAHLRQIGSDLAVTELVRIAAITDQEVPRRRAARDTLEEIALVRELDSLAQLIARTCPRVATGAIGERVVATQRAWLEQLLVDGDRLTAEDFLVHVAGHALRRTLTAGLVWGVVSDGVARSTFEIDADGRLVGVDGHKHVLEPTAHVGLAHPLEVLPEDRATWQQALAARGSAPAFPQLERPVFALTAAEGEGDRLERYAARSVGFAQLAPRLVALGWTRIEDRDGIAWVREFPRDNAIARARLDAGAVSDVVVRRRQHWQDRRLDTISAVTLSELLADLERAHARARR